MNTIKYEITTSYWFFKSNFLFFNNWIKKFFSNFICSIINYDFYAINFWMHYALFIIIFRRNKVNWYFYCIFHVSDFLRLFISFKYSQILLRYASTDGVFLSPLLLHSIFSTPKITYSYWLIIIFFFKLRKILKNL